MKGLNEINQLKSVLSSVKSKIEFLQARMYVKMGDNVHEYPKL